MSERGPQDHPEEGKGILFAGGAYALWGVVPLYWRLLSDVGPFEITIHRVLWCALTVSIVTIARGRALHVLSIFRTPRVLGALLASSILISANWTLFIWCVASHRLVEASLGYYMTPLVSIGLGVLLLGEKISALRLGAIALATIALVAKSVSLGAFPWIAPGLALSFGFYGYVRKLTPVDSLDGLTIETTLLFPLTLGIISVWALSGTGAFQASHPVRDIFLIASGPVTAVPLVMFAAGVRRVRLTTLAFLQYLSPSITLLVATVLLGEKFSSIDMVSFACVWAALILVGLEGQLTRTLARSRA